MACLGVTNLIYTGGTWAQSSCPLAPFRHKGGRDTNPSFGLSIGDESHFNCFVCDKGSLASLVESVAYYVGRAPQYRSMYDLDAARAILAQEDAGLRPLPDYREFHPSPYRSFEPWPDTYLSQFAHWSKVPMSVEYLAGRGLRPECADHFELVFDHARLMIGCPFRTASGLLAGMRGRGIDPEASGRFKHYDYTYRGANNTGIAWYHEQALNLPGPLLIVEGQFDCMRTWRHYPKVMAMLSAKTTPYKLRKLTSQETVILMLDSDETGRQKTEEASAWLLDHGVPIVGTIALPDGVKDPGEAPDEWLAEQAAELHAM